MDFVYLKGRTQKRDENIVIFAIFFLTILNVIILYIIRHILYFVLLNNNMIHPY